MLNFASEGEEIGHQVAQDDELNTVGCPNGICRGYELMRDLDFNDPDSYRDLTTTSNVMMRWTQQSLGSG